MRAYDTRVGRFFSVDPLSAEYPWYTPYQFAGNNPIKYIDRDGAEQGELCPGTDVVIIVVQGWANGGTREGSPPDGATQAQNNVQTNANAGPDEAFGTLPNLVGGNGQAGNVQTFVYASSLRRNTADDVAQTAIAFKKQNPQGRVIIVGHSLGAQNVVDALGIMANNNTKADLTITVDIATTGPGPFAYGAQYASQAVPAGSTDQLINYFVDPRADLTFDVNTTGVNVPLQAAIPGIDHRNVDNTLVGVIADDIRTSMGGGCSVGAAGSRSYRDVPLRQNGGAEGGGSICR